MVKVKSSFGKVSGTSANTIYYEVNGVTFGRSKPSKMGNPKTEAQMKQRIKMNNILNMYKYIKGYLQQNFEGIIGNKNASSFFRSYNLMKTPVWLAKEQKESYKFVLAPYVVAQGRITSVKSSGMVCSFLILMSGIWRLTTRRRKMLFRLLFAPIMRVGRIMIPCR